MAFPITGSFPAPAEAPAAEHLQGSAMWQSLYATYSALHRQVEIAESFRQWAGKREDGGGLLLQAQADELYCFVGDTHGHFRTLLYIICHVCTLAERAGQQAHFILLGDALDRGEEDFALLALIEDSLMQGNAGNYRMSFICGNHDLALEQDYRGYFHSAVRPAETAEHLNSLHAHGRGSHAMVLGQAAMELARTAPFVGELVGVGCEHGAYLFAHGCPPHTDVQQELAELQPIPAGAELISSLPEELHCRCRDDLMRGILTPQQGPIPPLRGFHGCKQGLADIAAYIPLHRRLTGRELLGIFRGHDHVPGGCRYAKLNGAFVCTLNAMGQGDTTIALMQADNGLQLIHFAE